MEQLDIVERLRGKVRVPVNDGAGLLDGKDFFERTFPTSKAAMEAADEIEKLRIQLGKVKRAPDFLKSLQRTAKIMRSAHDKGGDRLMSIWLEDLQAVEEAVDLLSHPDEQGKSDV